MHASKSASEKEQQKQRHRTLDQLQNSKRESDRPLQECKLVEEEDSPWLESAFDDVSGAELDPKEVYKARMSLYCKAIEDSFAAGANEGHLAWWAAVPTPAADEDGVPRLATILPLVFDVTGDHFLNPDTWRLSHWLLALRLSRAMASAVHEILSHAVVGLELSDLDPASARTLLSRCTRVNHLEMSLNEYGMMPFKMRSSSRPSGWRRRREVPCRSALTAPRREWRNSRACCRRAAWETAN